MVMVLFMMISLVVVMCGYERRLRDDVPSLCCASPEKMLFTLAFCMGFPLVRSQ